MFLVGSGACLDEVLAVSKSEYGEEGTLYEYSDRPVTSGHYQSRYTFSILKMLSQ